MRAGPSGPGHLSDRRLQPPSREQNEVMRKCHSCRRSSTGYSSLSYLQQFPIDVLKIDQSFVHRITGDPDDSQIVSAIISMGKSLKHLIVAEGIETQQQRAFLQAQHCAEGQGYLFSQPLAAAQFAHLLQMGLTETVVH